MEGVAGKMVRTVGRDIFVCRGPRRLDVLCLSFHEKSDPKGASLGFLQ